MGLWRHENIGFEQWCDCGRCGWWQHHDLRCRQTDTGWLCHPASQHETHGPRPLPRLQQISGKSILMQLLLSINSYFPVEKCRDSCSLAHKSGAKHFEVTSIMYNFVNALHVKMDKQWLCNVKNCITHNSSADLQFLCFFTPGPITKMTEVTNCNGSHESHGFCQWVTHFVNCIQHDTGTDNPSPATA